MEWCKLTCTVLNQSEKFVIESHLAMTRAFINPPAKSLSSVNVAFDTWGPDMPLFSKSGLLIEYEPPSTFSVSIFQIPLPPVFHGISGNIPLSKSHGDCEMVLVDGAGVKTRLTGGEDAFTGGIVGKPPTIGGSVGIERLIGGNVGVGIGTGSIVGITFSCGGLEPVFVGSLGARGRVGISEI